MLDLLCDTDDDDHQQQNQKKQKRPPLKKRKRAVQDACPDNPRRPRKCANTMLKARKMPRAAKCKDDDDTHAAAHLLLFLAQNPLPQDALLADLGQDAKLGLAQDALLTDLGQGANLGLAQDALLADFGQDAKTDSSKHAKLGFYQEAKTLAEHFVYAVELHSHY